MVSTGVKVAGALAATAVVGGGISAGITAVANRNAESGDAARGVAKGLGIAAGATAAIGVAGLGASVLIGRQDLFSGMLASIMLGLPSGAAVGIGAGLGGAALGTMLVAARRD